MRRSAAGSRRGDGSFKRIRDQAIQDLELGGRLVYPSLMKRALLASGLLLAVPQGAMAGGYTFIGGPMPLISPLAQSQGRNAGFVPAPVPNQDIVAPRTTKVPKPGEPEFVASLTTTAQSPRQGDGYAPGSRFSESLQRGGRGIFGTGAAPSIGVQVPIEK